MMLDLLSLVDHFEAKVYVFLQWKREGAPMKFLTSPIQPPLGYENESMAPPKVNPNQKGYPEHSPEYYKDLIDKMKAGGTNVISPAPIVPPQSPSPSAPQPQPAN